MKTVKIDENAHAILVQWKGICREYGIERPTFSDAIRLMHDGAKYPEAQQSVTPSFKGGKQ